MEVVKWGSPERIEHVEGDYEIKEQDHVDDAVHNHWTDAAHE